MDQQQSVNWRRGLAAFVAALWCCHGAQAALGGTPLPGGQHTTVFAGASAAASVAYVVSVTVLPSGTTMREFVSSAGQVFAVSWEGPLLPDLAQLLGDYASEYPQAVQQQRAMGQRGGVVQVQASRLVLVSRGRMGQFKGHAHVPALVPAGLDMQVLLP